MSVEAAAPSQKHENINPLRFEGLYRLSTYHPRDALGELPALIRAPLVKVDLAGSRLACVGTLTDGGHPDAN